MTKTAKPYLPSYKRVDCPPPMRLTERDQQIILAVYEYRLLSSEQIEALFFPSNSDKPHSRRTACQRRLQLLYHHGFLDRLPQPIILGKGRRPFVYALNEAGADFVADALGIDRADVGWKPKYNQLGVQFLDHSLGISDVRVVLQRLVDQGVFVKVHWVDELILKSAEMKDKVPCLMQGARPVRKHPDGYFRTKLLTGQEAHFFLEVDQGTMTNLRWQEKIRAYCEFRQSGRSKKHYGTHRFRVLTVTTGEKRLLNLKRATEKVKGDDHFWFTTQAAINIWQPEVLLNPVWLVASKESQLMLFQDMSYYRQRRVEKSI